MTSEAGEGARGAPTSSPPVVTRSLCTKDMDLLTAGLTRLSTSVLGGISKGIVIAIPTSFGP